MPSIAGPWDIAVKSPKGEEAWRLILRQSGAKVSAAILRVDGDTGTLTGTFRDGKFVLSHFSGARPALLDVTLTAEETLDIEQNKKNHLIAVRAVEARTKGLPEPADPSRWTKMKDPSEPLRFSAPDLNGKTVTEADPRFRGKVVVGQHQRKLAPELPRRGALSGRVVSRIPRSRPGDCDAVL